MSRFLVCWIWSLVSFFCFLFLFFLRFCFVFSSLVLLFSFVAAHIRWYRRQLRLSFSISLSVSWFSSHRTILASAYHPFIHSFIHSFIHTLTRSVIYPVVQLFVHDL
ncbi:hypothetical protein DFP72DRAFT_898733 [Ephemerocybe angulata]|uniref:Uncharacterized protein n=1 Tax=Ephemerocybe angulata TaxID=980116 RepID=A0A8H6M4V5_9AGAR|nr:hypothetical protein DFP72DRAFT_898733 [Tulosesus angulatus]